MVFPYQLTKLTIFQTLYAQELLIIFLPSFISFSHFSFGVQISVSFVSIGINPL